MRFHQQISLCVLCLAGCFSLPARAAELRVGTAKVDVTPQQLPVLVNGSMTSRSVGRITTHVNARAIVLDDGVERVALMVVDSCLMPRVFLDEVKELASSRTKLSPNRIMISATHTHTAPSVMAALGTEADPNYVPFLRQKLAEALQLAEENLQPAEVGWAVGLAPQFTALRRWVRRPDRIATDPFGNATVRANMHSARDPADAIGPTGPEDPRLSMICFRTPGGEPIAALCNFSMHYFGDKDISADYYGLFCDGLEAFLETQSPNSSNRPLAVMSHGCSGDIWRRDYMQAQPEAEGSIAQFAQGLLGIAKATYATAEYSPQGELTMQERRLPMKYRVPDQQRLAWAEREVEKLEERLPKTQAEIYAREQVFLDQMQETEVVVQAIRIGDIAIATTPTETYALTGLKLKHQSPLAKTMVIELANGGDGYIPPPEQHRLGGYNTWPARSAGLEVTAEPKIVASLLGMLEEVTGGPRRKAVQSHGPVAQAVLEAEPVAYWRLDELTGAIARDSSPNHNHAEIEFGSLYYLEGDDSRNFASDGQTNRSLHFVNSRLHWPTKGLGTEFTVVMSFWNGLPIDAREIAGWMFGLDEPGGQTARAIEVGVMGTSLTDGGGSVVAVAGGESDVAGPAIERWTWHRLAIVVTAEQVKVYVDDPNKPRVQCRLPARVAETWAKQGGPPDMYFGGRGDSQYGWEGKLDEIAVFDRPLNPQELSRVMGTSEGP